MGFTSEIFLSKKMLTAEDWQKFIETISKYNGFLKTWELFIINKQNQISYFIKTEAKIPTTINGLDSFLFKEGNKITLPRKSITLPLFISLESGLIDLFNDVEIKNKGTIECIHFSFTKLYEDKIRRKISVYIKKDNLVKKYRVVYANAARLLTADFTSNRRYFCKGVPKYLEINKILHLLDNNQTSSILKIDTFPYMQGSFYLNQSSYNFAKHSLILGSSGSGKSKFISSFVYNIQNNPLLKDSYKVVIIDPHAALENDIGGFSKVIDFSTKEDSIDLFSSDNTDLIASTETLLDLLKSLMANEYNSKVERILRHSLYALLIDNSFDFTNLRNLILDTDYRTNLINKIKGTAPSSVITFFLADFNELRTKSYSEAISPIIAFIDEMQMLPVFNGETLSNNLQGLIEENNVTLFSFDRTKLGNKLTKTISGLIMNQLLTLVQAQKIDKKIIFIVDEVPVVENPILAKFLSEARKYNLSLILAAQYFNQISEHLKNSIFANIINYYIFRISRLDASIIAENLNMKIPTEDTKEKKISLLSELNNRECIVKIMANDTILPAFKARTLDYTSIPRQKFIKPISTVINVPEEKPKSINFTIGSSVNLNEILKANSTSRKVVK